VLALADNNDPPIGALTCWLLLLVALGIGGGIFSLIWTLRLLRTTWDCIRPEELSR